MLDGKILTENKKGGDRMPFRSCSFTGHRQIKSAHKGAIDELVDKGIAYAYSEGCRSFYSGGAIGFDTIAARAVIRFRINHPGVKLILCLPCIDQSRHWSESQINDYEYILRSADEIIYASDEYTDTCIKARNMMLAELSDIVIAYVGRARSGSSQTARMAERLGKTVYNIYSALDEKTDKKA